MIITVNKPKLLLARITEWNVKGYNVYASGNRYHVPDNEVSIGFMLEQHRLGNTVEQPAGYLKVAQRAADREVDPGLSFAFSDAGSADGRPGRRARRWKDLGAFKDGYMYLPLRNRYNAFRPRMEDLLLTALDPDVDQLSHNEYLLEQGYPLSFEEVYEEWDLWFDDWYMARDWVAAETERRGFSGLSPQEKLSANRFGVKPIVHDVSAEMRASETYKVAARQRRVNNVLGYLQSVLPKDALNTLLLDIEGRNMYQNYLVYGILGTQYPNTVTGAGDVYGIVDYLQSSESAFVPQPYRHACVNMLAKGTWF